MTRALLLVLLAAGCSQNPAGDDADAGPQLEQAAIAAGIVRDPKSTDIAGLYARDTDRVCIVAARVGYRIGATVDYGGGQSCSASGTVARSGDALSVDLGNGCSFDARLDGTTIAFPGRLPDACDPLCSERASLTALEADLQSDVAAEAAGVRDAKGRPLCGS